MQLHTEQKNSSSLSFSFFKFEYSYNLSFTIINVYLPWRWSGLWERSTGTQQESHDYSQRFFGRWCTPGHKEMLHQLPVATAGRRGEKRRKNKNNTFPPPLSHFLLTLPSHISSNLPSLLSRTASPLHPSPLCIFFSLSYQLADIHTVKGNLWLPVFEAEKLHTSKKPHDDTDPIKDGSVCEAQR